MEINWFPSLRHTQLSQRVVFNIDTKSLLDILGLSGVEVHGRNKNAWAALWLTEYKKNTFLGSYSDFFTKTQGSIIVFGIPLLTGIYHDGIFAPELARRPSVLQPHQRDAGLGQPLRGQALVARYFHSKRQVRLVPRRDRGEQTHQAPARWGHFIQHQVREKDDKGNPPRINFLNRL